MTAAICIAVSSLPLPAQTLVVPSRADPGDPVAVWYLSPVALESGNARLVTNSGLALSSGPAFFMPWESQDEFLYGFLLAVPQGARPGKLTVTVKGLEAGKGIEVSAGLEIDAKNFSKEDIHLDAANTVIRTSPDPAKIEESSVFSKVFQLRDPTAVYAREALIKPIESGWRETAGFGDMRRYLYASGGNDTTMHGGIDIGAKEGTPVVACASGRVAFVARRIVTGNTIVIEHLPGLFSIYMHLSAVEVKEGEVVEQGQRIGRVGSTGLSTGPHLHWELRIGDVSVNPYRYLERPLLDKDAVSGKIKPPMEGR